MTAVELGIGGSGNRVHVYARTVTPKRFRTAREGTQRSRITRGESEKSHAGTEVMNHPRGDRNITVTSRGMVRSPITDERTEKSQTARAGTDFEYRD